MEALAMLKAAYKADRLTFLAWVAVVLAGCTALISGEWVTALMLGSLAAMFGGFLRGGAALRNGEETPTGTTGLVLAGGVGFLGVAFAHALGGEVAGAVLPGVAGAFILMGPVVGRFRNKRRTSSA